MNTVHNDKSLLDNLPAHVRQRIHTTVIGCWIYTGHPSSNGYMRVWDKGTRYMVHIWMLARAGRKVRTAQVDHLCQEIRCCNPTHLQPVSASVNQKRKFSRRKFPWDSAGVIKLEVN